MKGKTGRRERKKVGEKETGKKNGKGRIERIPLR
jgi:hypothetical protein